MQTEDYRIYRISKIRDYMFNVINTLTDNRDYQINANMLSDKMDDYSLDKIPTEIEQENWIISGGIKREVYSFRSLKFYSQDVVINLNNMGFFEKFEDAIETNNNEGNLPDIDGIESIKCLNPFTMISVENGKSATFDVQIEITYKN